MRIIQRAIKELNLLHSQCLRVKKYIAFLLEVRFCDEVSQERGNVGEGKG